MGETLPLSVGDKNAVSCSSTAGRRRRPERAGAKQVVVGRCHAQMGC